MKKIQVIVLSIGFIGESLIIKAQEKKNGRKITISFSQNGTDIFNTILFSCKNTPIEEAKPPIEVTGLWTKGKYDEWIFAGKSVTPMLILF